MDPQITAIASYVASRIPTEGVDEADAVEAWRTTLRYARRTGAIEPLTALMESSNPEDAELHRHCEDLRRR